ncbi:MAG TPA: hypothetical protein VNX21_01900 [Candidatus Thermoplasmatota archaeon]|nr:hypothetical protein [Candidatus Thermoplasmatota archaeon]
MRTPLVALLLVLSAGAALPAAAEQPCHPDACCGSRLDCAMEPVRRFLDKVVFPVECFTVVDWPDNGLTACYTLDPRAECHAWVMQVTKAGASVTCLA